MSDHYSQDEKTVKVGQMLLRVVEALIDEDIVCGFFAVQEGELTTFKIEIPRSQMGKVIGKEGKMARTIRTILQAVAHQMGRRFALDLEEGD
jgi:hypothetical protein